MFRTRIKSRSGKSFYAKRAENGRFADIQGINRSIDSDTLFNSDNVPRRKRQGFLGDY